MENKYFNFPIQLLEGFMENHKKCLSEISCYAVYRHSLKLEYGSELEKMKNSSSEFNMSFGNIQESLKTGKSLNQKYSGCPITGINIKTYWQFYDNQKTEYEKITLLAYLALKSIIGTKAMHKVTNEYWLSRMDGKPEKCELSQLSEPIKKYATEYHTVKLKNELVFNWGLITYSRYVRGFYISFSMPLDELIFQVEKRRKSNQKKALNEQTRNALSRANIRLGISRP
jgi:hypothetical protein